MGSAEVFEFVLGDEEVSDIAQGVLGVVFALDQEDLEDFPAKRGNLLDLPIHVFLEVVSVHDGVDFELDSVLLAQTTQSPHLVQMGSFSTTDFDVGFLVEGVA